MAVNTERAIQLLGNNIPAVQVAAAVGCTESYLSQLISTPEIAERISAIRYESLQQATARDSKLDSMEDKILTQLERAMPTVLKPMELLKALQVVNNAKRRGLTPSEQTSQLQSAQISRTLPTQVIKNFTVNVNNQVVGAGSQELVTATLAAVAAMTGKH